MTKLTITSAFAAAAADIKNPWVINNGIDLKGPFAGREAARAAKAEQELGGKIEKFELGNFEVEAAIPADAPKATKAPKKTVAHVNSSTIERPTKAVWHIADEMKAANPSVRRKDVIAECIKRGIANFTARTQYQQWFQVQKEMQAREAAQATGK